MGLRQEFDRIIKKKEQELAELRDQVARAESYLQALNDSMRLLPKDDPQAPTLRPNSELAKARDALKAEGQPLHITKILEAIRKPVTKAMRVSLSGSLSAYARRGEIFTRPLQNTFGLKEFESAVDEQEAVAADDGEALSLEEVSADDQTDSGGDRSALPLN